LEVIKVKQLCISECIDLSSKGAIKKKELVQYATNYEKLFVFYVKPMKKANSQISYFQLRERYNFNAPQNFVILSKEGKEIIEKLGKFKK